MQEFFCTTLYSCCIATVRIVSSHVLAVYSLHFRRRWLRARVLYEYSSWLLVLAWFVVVALSAARPMSESEGAYIRTYVA